MVMNLVQLLTCDEKTHPKLFVLFYDMDDYGYNNVNTPDNAPDIIAKLIMQYRHHS